MGYNYRLGAYVYVVLTEKDIFKILAKKKRLRLNAAIASFNYLVHLTSLFSEDGMTIFEPKSLLKNAASFWKKPAFEVSFCEAVISFPFASLTALPLLSTTSPLSSPSLGDGFHAAVMPSAEGISSNPLPSMLQATLAPSGRSVTFA